MGAPKEASPRECLPPIMGTVLPSSTIQKNRCAAPTAKNADGRLAYFEPERPSVVSASLGLSAPLFGVASFAFSGVGAEGSSGTSF